MELELQEQGQRVVDGIRCVWRVMRSALCVPTSALGYRMYAMSATPCRTLRQTPSRPMRVSSRRQRGPPPSGPGDPVCVTDIECPVRLVRSPAHDQVVVCGSFLRGDSADIHVLVAHSDAEKTNEGSGCDSCARTFRVPSDPPGTLICGVSLSKETPAVPHMFMKTLAFLVSSCLPKAVQTWVARGCQRKGGGDLHPCLRDQPGCEGVYRLGRRGGLGEAPGL